MKTNNSSENNKSKNLNQDVKEGMHEKRNSNQPENTGRNVQSNNEMNKGTGMSSEAGSDQTKKSWQGTGGSQSNTSYNKEERRNAEDGGYKKDDVKRSNTEASQNDKSKNELHTSDPKK